LSVERCDNGGGRGGRNIRCANAVNGAVKINGKAADVRSSAAHPVTVDSDDDDTFRLGKFVEGRLVYRQRFVIRSYEIGPDRTATMETLMNLLQVCTLPSS
jgi:fatty acyl-ACP thioesterase B